ncbi:hypothetical protein N7457_008098 [Penicillium paradoxum]|uniref:uncharacterized protein n=1 Tax=Penicillium paradoxum TaxID=176176 RepID=UPI0025481110|nr:uncharacterized protein N7457_008098 [Penicillium paradoxum]KAJ5773202.1 hypothetical protein N7457_008098 [Penicillium paradoxum]
MDIYARMRSSIVSWKHDIPLPPDLPVTSKFQSWYSFNIPSQQWDPVSPNKTTDPPHSNTPDITLLTWNIDALSKRSTDRVAEILTFITTITPKADIIFLQEVSQSALQQILADKRIRESWFSSEHENTTCRNSFTTMTLVSKPRCAVGTGNGLALGPVWRVSFPSYFGRDALFCDIFLPSSTDSTRVRLANVHLDSLPIKPSHRPRQLSIVSSFLRSAGCGLVAGDFNPVLEDDAGLVEDNGLTDVWTALRPGEPGYTWGADGEQAFPANRMDKVALLGLEACDIQVFAPQPVGELVGRENARIDTDRPESQQIQVTDITLWSDHHAVLCSFRLGE